MTTIGTDCHIVMTHANVNEGAAFGFLLDSEDDLGPLVSLQREVNAEGTITVRLFFKVLLADDLVNPDGTMHAETKAEMYSKLCEFLSQTDGMTVEGSIGVFTNVGAQGHSATEMHYLGLSVVACQLNNQGVYWPPADPERFYNSVWDGTMSWGMGYWR
jgi:hypothetical protein